MSTLLPSNSFKPETDRSGWLLGGMLVLSVVGHVWAINVLPERLARPETNRVVEMDFLVEQPKPPPPEPPKEEPPKPPPPEPPKIKIKQQVKVEAPPPKEDLPPPPNETPQEPPKGPPPMLVVGLTMNSTTATGGFAVQVGNTTMGQASSKVVDPSQVKAYSAPKYAPPGSADEEPSLVGEAVKFTYPEEARLAEIEGNVRLRVSIDAEGTVTAVSIISGPGYGLNELARDAMKKMHFRPATKGGEKVAYTFTFTYLCILD